MTTYNRLALEDALREEFRKHFLESHRLKIRGDIGVFIDQKKVRREQSDLVVAELEAIQAIHGGHDAGLAVLKFPFALDEWLTFADRYGVADLWTVTEFVAPSDGRSPTDSLGRPRRRVARDAIDLLGIQRLRLV